MRLKKYPRVQVTIIVLTYNHARLTLECLTAIANCTKNSSFEVILVDNGSDSRQLDLLKKGLARLKSLPLRFIRNSKNLGYTKANNAAARKAAGEILVFLNNDVIVTPGWLISLSGFLQKHPKVAACQPKLHSYFEKEYFDPSGAGGFLDMFGYPFTRGRVFNFVEKDLGQYDNEKDITWATGTALAVTREPFWEVGGFDEYFFIYNEEIDLCIRLRQAGYEIFCVPRSLVYHYGAYTTGKAISEKIFLLHHNNLYFILKHYSLWPYFPIIIFRFLLDAASIVYYLKMFRFDLAYSVFRAYLKLVVRLAFLVKRGTITFKGRSLLADKTVYRGSIVLKHFIFGYKTFNQIFGNKTWKVGEYKQYVDITTSGKR